MATLPFRIRQCARLSGSFTLRSGKVSDTYFDKYQFEADPKLLLAIAQAMVPLVPEGTEVLAGLEMGGIPIVTMMSQVAGIPAAFIRKEPTNYGTCRYAEGAALAKLRADGFSPSAALCVIDRETGGRQALAAAGLPLKSLVTITKVENGA